MSTLSRYPLGIGQRKARTPFADKTNEADDGEAAYMKQSRKTMKKGKPPTLESKPSNLGIDAGRVSPKLVISTSLHPRVSRVIKDSSDLRSPPFSSLLQMHTRKQQQVKRSSLKKRNLVELEDAGSLSSSTSLEDLNTAFKLDGGEEEEKKEEEVRFLFSFAASPVATSVYATIAANC